MEHNTRVVAETESAASVPSGRVSGRNAATADVKRRRYGFVIASILTGVGLTVLLWSRLGVVPMDVLHIGAARMFGWSVGVAIIVVQTVLLLVALVLVQRKPRPGLSSIAAFVVPASIVYLLLPTLPHVDTLPMRIGAFVLGMATFCCGIALYLLSQIGQMPREVIMLALARDRPDPVTPARRIAAIRIVMDIAFIGAGVLLMGPVNALLTGALGVGTLVLTFGCGPLIAYFLSLGRLIVPPLSRTPIPE